MERGGGQGGRAAAGRGGTEGEPEAAKGGDFCRRRRFLDTILALEKAQPRLKEERQRVKCCKMKTEVASRTPVLVSSAASSGKKSSSDLGKLLPACGRQTFHYSD